MLPNILNFWNSSTAKLKRGRIKIMRYIVWVFVLALLVVLISCSSKLASGGVGACNNVTELMDKNLEGSFRQRIGKPIGTVSCDDFQEIDSFEGLKIIIIPGDALAKSGLNLGQLATSKLVRQSLDGIKNDLEKANQHFTNFGITPVIGVTIDKIGGNGQNYGLIDLIKNEKVGLLVQDIPVASLLTESLDLIGAPSAWQSQPTYEGKDMTVAVVDTGIDGTHPVLKDKVIAEACFSTNDPIDGSKAICPERDKENEKYFGEGLAIPCDATGCEHGTMVASIVAGVAPKVNIIAIQVFSRFEGARGGKICTASGMDAPCVLSYLSDQLAALEFIEEITRINSDFNLGELAAVNMSLGGGVFVDVNCTNDPRAYLVNILRERGVPTIVAAGNDGESGGISAPACIPGTISVASVDDGSTFNNQHTSPDTVSPHSNIASFVSLAAPGRYITAAIPGNGYATGVGTSFAAPHVAGAWALLKQKYPNDTVGNILTRLKASGHSVVRDNIQLSRIDLGTIFGDVQKIVVNNTADEGEGSLRQAIEQAEQTEAKDTIVFDEQVFKESQTIFFSEPIYIYRPLTIQGTGRDKLFLDGADSSRIFIIEPTSVSLSNMTLTRGFHAHGGGAIYNSGNLFLKSVNFIENNGGTGPGGAIRNHGNLGINKVIFKGNKAGFGGAINNIGGLMDIANSSFIANAANSFGGGAIDSNVLGSKGSIWISHSTFESNLAQGQGGAIAIKRGVVIIKSSFFGNNQAGNFGGALAIKAKTEKQNDILIENTTIAGNEADVAGGLAVYDFSKVTLHHTTIAHNIANYAGGIHVGIGTNEKDQKRSGLIELESTLIANNASTNDQHDLEFTTPKGIVRIGYNCIESMPDDLFTEEDCINHPISLELAKYNGGRTKTVALKPNSLAVNKIKDCRVAFDQRDKPRPLANNDEKCDVGAFELHSSP